MALGRDFLLEDGGDLDMTNGDVQQVVSIGQAVQKVLRLVRGEWFLDLAAGVPYFEYVLIKSPQREHIEQIIKAAILSVEGVRSVVSMTLDFDNSARRLTITFTADTDEGVITEVA